MQADCAFVVCLDLDFFVFHSHQHEGNTFNLIAGCV